MAIIKGRVLFNPKSDNSKTDIGISYVRVTLQNINTRFGVSVLTDNKGEFIFENIPVGDYRLVEGSNINIGDKIGRADFSTAKVISKVNPGDPGIEGVAEMVFRFKGIKPNKIQSITPNVLSINITNTEEIVVKDFIDAPVVDIYSPKGLFETIGENLFSFANNGSFGDVISGAEVNTNSANTPYVDVIENSFVYMQYSNGSNIEANDRYTVINTINIYGRPREYDYFILSDHTLRDERGRMLVLTDNSADINIINKTIEVKQNTNYIFSFWASNLVSKYPQNFVYPRIGVKVENLTGDILLEKEYDLEVLGIPLWKEISSFINSGDNSQLVFKIYIKINSKSYNYYAIDDISLFEVVENNKPQIIKMVDKNMTYLGDILTYDLVFKNENNVDLNNILISDKIPLNTILESDSIKFDGEIISKQEVIKVIKPFLNKGETVTLTYKLRIDNNPGIDRFLENIAYASYEFTGISQEKEIMEIESNKVTTTVNSDKLEIIRYVNKKKAIVGEELTYLITVVNSGNIVLDNVVINECISKYVRYVPNSLNINGKTMYGQDKLANIVFSKLVPGERRTISYSVKVICHPCNEKIMSISKAKYEYCTSASVLKEWRSAESNVVVTELVRPIRERECSCR